MLNNNLKRIEVTKLIINELYTSKVIKLSENPFFDDIAFPLGELLILVDTGSTTTAPCYTLDDEHLYLVKDLKIHSHFKPRDIRQNFYYRMLKNDSVLINVCLGPAGTGKTVLAVSHAIDRYFNENKRILLTKPTVMVSEGENNAFGPVPGDIQEKYAPYISSFEIAFKKVMSDNSSDYIKTMMEKKHVEFIPLELTRGCTYEDCTFIVDEVQNLSWHELKTIMSRMGENANLILCGDIFQIDTKRDYTESGIYKLIKSDTFKESEITSYSFLSKQYRGPIPDLIYNIDVELFNKEKE